MATMCTKVPYISDRTDRKYTSTCYFFLLEKTKPALAPRGRDASTAEAAPGRVGRGEQSDARPQHAAYREVDLISG